MAVTALLGRTECFAPCTGERRVEFLDIALAALLLAHIALLLSHRTNGGWQYGTRYLIDTIPVALYLYGKKRGHVSVLEALLMGALIAFNVYGSILFHFL